MSHPVFEDIPIMDIPIMWNENRILRWCKLRTDSVKLILIKHFVKTMTVCLCVCVCVCVRERERERETVKETEDTVGEGEKTLVNKEWKNENISYHREDEKNE